ncbi:MAG TPA: hypothetical protein VN516_02340, partial [Candidatus Baltobacteraceae bacterium]|nr:hypothetical protein [Candidatus Baltobacteraceae bacterium]
YLAAVIALGLLCGCRTNKKEKQTAALRVHIQIAVPTTTSQTVSVLRASPLSVTILKEPILTEADIAAVRVIDAPGGFAIQIKFSEQAVWILEQYSASNPGRHFAVYGQWGEKLSEGRWLAAPLITKRISDGILTFTADMSRDEAVQMVDGLNNVGKTIRKSIPKTMR